MEEDVCGMHEGSAGEEREETYSFCARAAWESVPAATSDEAAGGTS